MTTASGAVARASGRGAGAKGAAVAVL